MIREVLTGTVMASVLLVAPSCSKQDHAANPTLAVAATVAAPERKASSPATA